MNIPEILTITTGLSLDVCALLMCKGALLSHIDKKKLALICLIFTFGQELALFAGNLIHKIPLFHLHYAEFQILSKVIPLLIFFGLGGYMMYQGIKAEPIFEHRKEILPVKEIFLWSFLTSQDALFAGTGLGFLGANLPCQMICLLITTNIAVIAGLYCGYRSGYIHKSKIHIIGALLLICSGIFTIIKI